MKTYGFIGLGLIGGSIARAIRETQEDARIIAHDVNQESLRLALSDGVANEITDAIDDRFSACDYLFLCAPVQKNDSNLLLLKPYLSPDCLLTDVGSVKTDIHENIKKLGLEAQFIGGHPMAGSERVGYVNSKSVLLQNAYYILTPTPEVSKEKLESYRELVSSFGSIPLILSCEEHDYVTAAVSHLPHVISASLVNLVRDSDNADGLMKMIAAGGFKDITRISSSSAAMWQQICLTNTGNIEVLLDRYVESLERFRTYLKGRDSEKLYETFDSARIYRDSFISASSGPIKKSFVLMVDIADEPGAIAAIATILALNQVSIKNIGITHNREYEGGVLRIELYDKESTDKAESILKGKGYTIYTRD